VLPQQALVQNQKSLLEYWGASASRGKRIRNHGRVERLDRRRISPILSTCLFVTILPKLCLFVYSMTAAARHGRSAATDTVEAQPLVLLRSLVEMQKKLIEALYAE